MKFRLNENILIEGKNIEKTWEQYKDRLEQVAHENRTTARSLFLLIIAQDPTFESIKSGTTGDYGIWLLNRFLNGEINNNPTEWQKIYDLLKSFIEKKSNLEKKDINQYKSVQELENTLTNTDLSPRQKERKLRSTYKEAELVCKGDIYDIWVPQTYASSCTLGKGTEWCTADSRTREYWDYYNKEGHKLYILINRNDPTDKYQFSDMSFEFKDPSDTEVDMENINDDVALDFLYKINMKYNVMVMRLSEAFNSDPMEVDSAMASQRLHVVNASTNYELFEEIMLEHYGGRRDWMEEDKDRWEISWGIINRSNKRDTQEPIPKGAWENMFMAKLKYEPKFLQNGVAAIWFE